MGWKARLILGGRTVFFFIDLSFSDTDVVVTKCFLFKFIKVSRVNKLLSIFSNSALNDESILNFFIDLSFSDTDVVVTKCFLFKFIKVSRINKLLSIFSNSALIDESSLNFARLRLACVMVGGQEVTESKGVGAMWNVSPSYGAS